MSTKSPGPQRCRLILQQCLAIQLTKSGNAPEDFWMYDSGYMIFQNFLAANSKCWWNTSLTAALNSVKYAGHVAPGMLLVTAEPCALEILRGAYSRSVLKPPAGMFISYVGDIDDCIVAPIQQTQFTPLTEAICDVIMDLTSHGHSATLETIRKYLAIRFSNMQQPSNDIVYDTLVQLQQERKIYQTAKGFFIVTPERRRSRSRPPRNQQRSTLDEEYQDERLKSPHESRTILMSNSEAVRSLYGEITTERDGDLTHQCIQTNLADVICGGNPNDKILYPRSAKRRSASFPTPRSLERRHSLRLFGSTKRLQRCQSTKSLQQKNSTTLPANISTTTSGVVESSSSEYQSTDSSSPKKSASLLSRIFRRSTRATKKIETYSAQFPPREWFNSKAIHLQSVGTQTTENDSLSSTLAYDGSELSQRSLTLPRRHRRNMSSESTFLLSSRDCSPIRRRSPAICYGGSLPRSTHSIPGRSPKRTPLSKHIIDEKNRAMAKSSEIYEKSSLLSGPNSEHTPTSSRFQSRSIYSGPSSLESGKTSSLVTSGPSSIDSGNKSLSLSRNSGHSSLDSSHGSALTVAQSQGSPKSVAKLVKSCANKVTTSTSSCGLKSTSFEEQSSAMTLPSSTSSGSITLQVTNNSCGSSGLPKTKIFVQNSPVHTSITFENGKLIENSNVFVINNESTLNSRGEVIANRKTIINNPSSPLKQQNQQKRIDKQQKSFVNGKENVFSENDEVASETGDSLSMISEMSPDSSLIPFADDDIIEFDSRRQNNVQSPENHHKSNINNSSSSPMNNNRKLSLQLGGGSSDKNGSAVVYNNMLKNHYNQQTNAIISPMIQNNTGKMNLFSYEAGSVGNLKSDLKSNSNFLNSNPNINSDSLFNIFHKNIIAVGSEPNLIAMNKQNDGSKQKINNCIKDSSSPQSAVEEKTPTTMPTTTSSTDTKELYNFPSLTDLSFNFTSLHAQKILNGGGMSVNNSIDTLCELDINNKPNNHKSNSNLSPSATICTDFGLV